jgi:thioredoxin reductase (NADPH)
LFTISFTMNTADHQETNADAGRVYDCIIIGAGPGGLQAAIYLGRCNRDVLVLDRGGGRTWHAKHIENVLTHREITGKEIIERGIEQAKSFHVQFERTAVVSVQKNGSFTVTTKDAVFRSRFVIAATGVYDIIPPIENAQRFLGAGYFTCIDCDGYRTTDKKLIVIGNSLHAYSLALTMKQMFTRDITFIPYQFNLIQSFAEVLRDEGITLMTKRPVRIVGNNMMEAIELEGGERVPCEAIMAHFGFRLNNEYLSGCDLQKDKVKFKYVTSSTYESSLSGLYIVGPLNTGHDQVVIAAGEGAVAALDINRRLLDEKWNG